MLDTVEEFSGTSNYFTIELKNKFESYEFKQQTSKSGKINWKSFFADTYAEE
jgi:hypothetical protein